MVNNELTATIMKYLIDHPESTAKEISAGTGLSFRSVCTKMPWMRGDGLVDDGSPTPTNVYDDNGRLIGIAHGAYEYPVKWTAIRK
jgi:hypothetical protein